MEIYFFKLFFIYTVLYITLKKKKTRYFNSNTTET